jgi:tRNA 2-thiouridine synthesizing protein E
MEKVIAGKTVNVNEDGYLTDHSQWDKDIANKLAKEKGIDLTEKHWEVIDLLQNKYKNEEPLSIRGLKKSGVVNIKDFYELFPGGPLKVSTLIAGIPKPKSCM